MKAGRGFLALLAVLTAGAFGAPLAHAGSYDVLSCTIDGAYNPNNAWIAANNPAGDARYATDAACPSSGDPLSVRLAGGNSFGNGTAAGAGLLRAAERHHHQLQAHPPPLLVRARQRWAG